MHTRCVITLSIPSSSLLYPLFSYLITASLLSYNRFSLLLYIHFSLLLYNRFSSRIYAPLPLAAFLLLTPGQGVLYEGGGAGQPVGNEQPRIHARERGGDFLPQYFTSMNDTSSIDSMYEYGGYPYILTMIVVLYRYPSIFHNNEFKEKRRISVHTTCLRLIHTFAYVCVSAFVQMNHLNTHR